MQNENLKLDLEIVQRKFAPITILKIESQIIGFVITSYSIHYTKLYELGTAEESHHAEEGEEGDQGVEGEDGAYVA